MATAATDPLLDALVNDFGGNYVFALDLLEQYRQDRLAVEPSWREYFDRATGVTPLPQAKAGDGQARSAAIPAPSPTEPSASPAPPASVAPSAPEPPVGTTTVMKVEAAPLVVVKSRA
jgi:hypothetical protein